MIWVWVAVIAIAIIVEVLSAQLLSIWFALGGVAALAASFFTKNIAIQVFLFLAVSIVALAIIYPLARKSLKIEHVKTNADRYIGKRAVVTEEISNIDAKGQVKVDNQIWSARSENGEAISEGTEVHVLRIEGVKLIVSVNK
ncbi:MAG: NfeD family protein [Eubacterium sp.]|nr:NfeD family protein [Eubacterium sp.]